MNGKAPIRYEFGPFRLDLQKGVLLHYNEPVRLTQQAFKTLAMLVQSRGQVVRQEELAHALWPDVSFDTHAAVTLTVSRLRKALGQFRDGRDYVMTVPGGYRFVADVIEQASSMRADKADSDMIEKLLLLPTKDLINLLGEQVSGASAAPSPSTVNDFRNQHQPRVFLSYARPDRGLVSALFDKLTLDRFIPWMDVRSILPGEKWRLAIERAIHDSDFFILCLSANSVDRRGFLQREIQIAMDKLLEFLDGDIYFIPARLSECRLPSAIAAHQAVDLFEYDGYARLVLALKVGFMRRFTPDIGDKLK